MLFSTPFSGDGTAVFYDSPTNGFLVYRHGAASQNEMEGVFFECMYKEYLALMKDVLLWRRSPLKAVLMAISMAFSMLAPAAAMPLFSDKHIEIKAENAMFRGVDALEPDGKLILTVESVRADRRGTSAIKRSPSLLSGYADPVVVTGYVVTPADERWRHHKVNIRLPEREWARIAAKAQDIIGVGIIDTDNGPGLLCLQNLSSLDEKGGQAWLHSDACRKRWDK